MGKHRTPQQEKLLIDYMHANPESGVKHTKGDRVIPTAAWGELVNNLNAVGPPIKSAEEWRKVYSDWKLHTKKKISARKTGVKASEEPLSPAEQSVAMAMGLASVIGTNAYDLPVGENETTMETATDSDLEETRNAGFLETPPICSTSTLNQSSLGLSTNISNTLGELVAEENAAMKELMKELVKELREIKSDINGIKHYMAESCEVQKRHNVVLEALLVELYRSKVQ